NLGEDWRRRSRGLSADRPGRIARVRLRAGEGCRDRLVGVSPVGMLLEHELDRAGVRPGRHRPYANLLADEAMPRLGDGSDLADLGVDQGKRRRDPVVLVKRDLLLARPLELPFGLVEGWDPKHREDRVGRDALV